MKRATLSRVLRLLGTEWTGSIMVVMEEGEEIRHSALRKKLDGISGKVLTDRLRTLEHEGFVYRKEDTEGPGSVVYGLTSRGCELTILLGSLDQLATDWK